MIVTNRIAFLHLHKSGGTFVNECLLRHVRDARIIGYHLPRRMLPIEHRGKTVLGLVRNPWSYYVSWYAFQTERRQPNSLFRILSEDGSLGFERTIRNMLELGSSGTKLAPVLAALPNRYLSHGINLPNFALRPIAGSGKGFYSFLYHYLYDGGGEAARIATMERLAEDLPGLLEGAGETMTPAMRAFIAGESPRNTSKHAEFHQYYGSGLRDLVAERDADIIHAHGYAFDP
jgi:hypothetical protein